MRARNVTAAVVGSGSSLRVWNAAFEFEGLSLPVVDGKVNEAARKKIQDKIARAIAMINFDLEES